MMSLFLGFMPKIFSQKSDTTKIRNSDNLVKPYIFESAFFEKTKINIDTFLLEFHSVDIGKIKIETGKIIACDPAFIISSEPFSDSFPIGFFPVQLAIAKVDSSEVVSFSRIYFSDSPVVNWEFAILKGQKRLPIFGEDSYVYPVDGGSGCFIDEKIKSELSKKTETNDTLLELLNKAMNKNHYKYGQSGILNFGDFNIAAFSSGVGDGRYSTYIGYDKNGKPCRLLTDFGIVNWWK